ncbi:glycosyltransferase family 34 protein [Amniculicola lignicola CBS 123094]|uniref:Glycosyltransferase family 34 protein n=1 Tax=Amniculicola lignicola CBS 123094 TaxID=1392246 RepID=A0A6A5WTR2_9PLEO|nr:glycosyltransferase family 34 protein [Amniculicola lignicola CBS 123094]
MHFAMPPRKTSRPPPYAARNSRPYIPLWLKNRIRRPGQPRVVVVGCLVLIVLIWLLRGSGPDNGVGLATPVIGTGAPIVIVTVLDQKKSPGWIEAIKKNREDYARRHGYKTFFPNNTDYPLRGAPSSWAKIPALRHAMTLHPTASFFWSLDPTALIMNSNIALHTSLLTPQHLERVMIVNEPIVPPDSVIKTFGNLKGDRIDVVVTQDKDGLTQSSFLVKNGEWAKYFLDAWFDPIYRSYNFQKAEAHALEHLVQWHGTILAKLALVPQNLLNSYASGPAHLKHGQYKEGDIVANFPGCDKEKRNCADEMEPFLAILRGEKN